MRTAYGDRIRIDYVGKDRTEQVRGLIGFELKNACVGRDSFADFANAVSQSIDYQKSRIQSDLVDREDWFASTLKWTFMFPCSYRIYEKGQPHGARRAAGYVGAGSAEASQQVRRGGGGIRSCQEGLGAVSRRPPRVLDEERADEFGLPPCEGDESGVRAMKRAAVDHPKMFRLCGLLKLRRWEAIGILESLWLFTARFAPCGDVGKYPDTEIARGIDWNKDATRLVEALVEAGWLDRCDCHRIVVHDWEHHADQTLKRSLASNSLAFVKHEASIGKPAQPELKTDASPPVPEPEPEPVPEPEPESETETPTATKVAECDALPLDAAAQKRKLTAMGWVGIRRTPTEVLEALMNLREDDLVPLEGMNTLFMIRARLWWFEEFWMDYWRKGAKRAALVAYFDRVTTLAQHDEIIEAVQAQLPGMMARPEDKRPQGASWINGERWEDAVLPPPSSRGDLFAEDMHP